MDDCPFRSSPGQALVAAAIAALICLVGLFCAEEKMVLFRYECGCGRRFRCRRPPKSPEAKCFKCGEIIEPKRRRDGR